MNNPTSLAFALLISDGVLSLFEVTTMAWTRECRNTATDVQRRLSKAASFTNVHATVSDGFQTGTLICILPAVCF